MSHDRIDRFTCDKCGKIEDNNPNVLMIRTGIPQRWLHVSRDNLLGTSKDFCSEACLLKYYQLVMDQRKGNK